MVSKYNYIRLNANSRSEFVLAIQHAENNGFPVDPYHVRKFHNIRVVLVSLTHI
ncbi:hypothetical protein BRC2024_FNJIJEUR_CDS_0029 [Acinetobacter phage vB_AbaP_Tama]